MKTEKTDDNYIELRNAIIIQAMQDYKAIRSGRLKETGSINKAEIIEFFKNDCYGLLADIEGIRGTDIFASIRYKKYKRTYKTTLLMKRKGNDG